MSTTSKQIGLWRYNHSTGQWVRSRQCSRTNAQQVLAVWQDEFPMEHFRLAVRKPKGRPR